MHSLGVFTASLLVTEYRSVEVITLSQYTVYMYLALEASVMFCPSHDGQTSGELPHTPGAVVPVVLLDEAVTLTLAKIEGVNAAKVAAMLMNVFILLHCTIRSKERQMIIK